MPKLSYETALPDLPIAKKIKFGMVLPSMRREDTIAYALNIENAGFDSLWTGDHIAFHNPILESLTTLSFIASITQHLQLATGVYLLPLRNPSVVAKITSTLDVLSGGRLMLGVGSGGDFAPEFAACGVPLEERGRRTDEGIALIRKLWTQDNVSSAEGFFRFGPISLNPKPLQPGGPKIIVGGRKGATFRRAAQLGDGYISHMCTADQYQKNLKEIANHPDRRRGWPDHFETAAYLFTFIEDSYRKALPRANEALSKIYNMEFSKADNYCLLGTPADMANQIKKFIRAGARHFVFCAVDNPEKLIAAFPEIKELVTSDQISG